MPIHTATYVAADGDEVKCSYISPIDLIINSLSRPGVLGELLPASVPPDLLAKEFVHGRAARTHPYFAADRVSININHVCLSFFVCVSFVFSVFVFAH